MTWGTPNKKVDFISRQHVKDRKAQHGWAVTSHHWVSLLVSLSCNIWWCWPCHTTDLINQWPTTTGHLMMLTIGAMVNKGVRPAHNDLICIGWGSSMASILVCSCSRCSHQYVINEQLLCWKFFSRTLRFWGTPCLSSASVPWKQSSKSAQNGPKVSQSGPNQHFKWFRPCWTFLHLFGKVRKKLFSEVEDTLEVIYVIGVFSLWKQLFPKVSKSVWKCSRGVLKWSKPLFKVFLAVLDLLQHFWTVFEGFRLMSCNRAGYGSRSENTPPKNFGRQTWNFFWWYLNTFEFELHSSTRLSY